MPDAPAAAEELERVFRRIHETRMDGVPILNPQLQVEVVGVRSWNGCSLAVLVTPWFINLMLLPATVEQAAAFAALPLGTKQLHRLPAGRFEFIVGEEADLGRYEMCSLFSPVLEFESQEAARLAAAAALEALFDASLDPASGADEPARTDAARSVDGTTPAASAAGENDVGDRDLTSSATRHPELPPSPTAPQMGERGAASSLPALPSRRGFLTGRLQPREGSR